MTKLEFTLFMTKLINQELKSEHRHLSLDEWYQLLDESKYNQIYRNYKERA